MTLQNDSDECGERIGRHRSQPFITAGPSCLRYRVTRRFRGRDVRKVARELSKKTGWSSGVYVLVHCAPELSDRQVARAALRLEAEILYVGLSETKWHVRVAMLGQGLSGGALCHDAAKWVARTPSIEQSKLRLILISFSPAFSLEAFLIEEHGRLTNCFPRFNFTRGGRSSCNVRKQGLREIDWTVLRTCLGWRYSPESEANALSVAYRSCQK